MNAIDRQDVVFLLPVHKTWLNKGNGRQLIAVISRSRYTVAVAMADSSANPLASKEAVHGRPGPPWSPCRRPTIFLPAQLAAPTPAPPATPVPAS